MALSPDCAFVLCVEQGRLEAQAVLLVDSLRKFGGVYADCPVYAFSPRPSRQMSAECQTALVSRHVEVLVESLISPDEPYGTAARLAVCVWAENNLTCETLVSLDDDLFFVREPDFNLREADFIARPVDGKGICTTGEGDPFDAYWRRIAHITEVDYDQIPMIETTLDRVRVKASYNGGMVAVRRSTGLFQRAQEMFRICREQAVSPYEGIEPQILASTGFVSMEASRWWGSAQAVLSLAATQLKARIMIPPPTYNVPAHMVQRAEQQGIENILKDAILVHYHYLLDQEYCLAGTLFYGSAALPVEIFDWLKLRVPLGETITPAGKRRSLTTMLKGLIQRMND